jgi:hypothetical protein
LPEESDRVPIGRGSSPPTFRNRAFMMARKSGADVRHASIAHGCNVDTLMKHYVATDEQQVTDAVFAKMHGIKPPG